MDFHLSVYMTISILFSRKHLPPGQLFDDGLGKMVLPNFCVPLGPRAAGGGPSGTQKLIYFLLARTFHENIFEAKASRKPCENLAKTSRKPPKVNFKFSDETGIGHRH